MSAFVTHVRLEDDGWCGRVYDVGDIGSLPLCMRSKFASEGEALEWSAAQKALAELPDEVELQVVQVGEDVWLEMSEAEPQG